eukprot:13306990-Alexandrium_andersonii.AAC.1
MSASLVGSEMCIRDRRGAVSGHVRAGAPSREICLGHQAATAGRGSPYPAVSYTHLTLPTICSV